MRNDECKLQDPDYFYAQPVAVDGVNYGTKQDKREAGLTDELSEVVTTDSMPDPNRDFFGNSRNEMLDMIRAKHPFLDISPPLGVIFTYSLLNGSAEKVVPVPSYATMYRVSFAQSTVSAPLGLSHQRGIKVQIGSTGDDEGVVINPDGKWRYCLGVSEVVLKHCGSSGNILVSIEFHGQN